MKIGNNPLFFRRIMVTLLIQLGIIICLLELGLRFLETRNHSVRALLYDPHLPSRYEGINTLEGLLNTSFMGFTPYAKRSGFVLNSRSFRTKEYSRQKPAGNYRILAIGDSFTAGSGRVPYSRHWAVLLEDNLRSAHLDTSEVISLGVGAVGPRFELRLWEIEGSKLQADLVVLAFCIGNDFTDEQKDTAQKSLPYRIAEKSYVFRLTRNLYRLIGAVHPAEVIVNDQIDRRGGYETNDYVYDPNEPTFARPAFLDIVADRMSITHKANQAAFARLFANLKPVLLFFRDSVVESGAKFVVMMIPDEYQVDPNLLVEAASHSGYRAEDFDVDLPQASLSRFFQENNIAYIDLLPAFKQQAKTTVLYRLQDTHWNIEGNRLAASLLAEQLRRFIETQAPTISSANTH